MGPALRHHLRTFFLSCLAVVGFDLQWRLVDHFIDAWTGGVWWLSWLQQ